MSYSENLARVVTQQLERFVTLNRHQLVGHVANLDFWLGEARHALSVLDGYESRFRSMKEAQDAYVTLHQTQTWWPTDPDIAGRPSPPVRVPDVDRQTARRELADATYHFLVRCFKETFLDETAFRTACGQLGIGIDPSDLQRARA